MRVWFIISSFYFIIIYHFKQQQLQIQKQLQVQQPILLPHQQLPAQMGVTKVAGMQMPVIPTNNHINNS